MEKGYKGNNFNKTLKEDDFRTKKSIIPQNMEKIGTSVRH